MEHPIKETDKKERRILFECKGRHPKFGSINEVTISAPNAHHAAETYKFSYGNYPFSVIDHDTKTEHCCEEPPPVCSTPSPSTDELRARYLFRSQPLKSLSLGDLTDLLIAYASEEISQGCLSDMTGLNPDVLRAMVQDAVSRSDLLFRSWRASEEARFKESRGSSNLKEPPSKEDQGVSE